MAKSQKRSNREVRKPKQEKPKVEVAARSFLGALERSAELLFGGKKGWRR
jgi:hypothetical protein